MLDLPCLDWALRFLVLLFFLTALSILFFFRVHSPRSRSNWSDVGLANPEPLWDFDIEKATIRNVCLCCGSVLDAELKYIRDSI